ncbi:MAG: hypothetical protein HFJ58_00165 [Clostridia bacterium]|nr:hypothetical protein [Clostridia bacterium]
MEKQHKINYMYNKGITLIALIITIIILLILAGVTINLTLGDNGLFKTAEQAVKNYTDAQNKERNYIDNLDNTIKNIMGGNKTPSKPTLVSQITPNDYGKTINYSVTVKNNNNENVTLNDWKVFYNDGNNVYIIMSNVLDGSLFPANSGLSNDGRYHVWTAGWETTSSSTDAAAILRDNTIWADFARGNGASSATGSPTAEMLVASWNSNPVTNVVKQIDFNSPHFVGSSDSSGLYFIPASVCSGGYWLASESALNPGYSLWVARYSGFNYENVTSNSTNGIRPVICLRADVTGTVGDTVTM